MVTYSHYETDNRVMRYAEELARQGHAVEVLALKREPKQLAHETLAQVRVTRLQCRSRKNQISKAALLFPIVKFSLLASLRIAYRHLKSRYDLVHVHNVPDFLVFVAWFPALMGTKVILDIHDILPEFYASKFGLAADSLGVRALKKVERASARFADHVIISNDLWRDRFVARTGINGKCSVFINHVDCELFRPYPRTRSDGKLILLFPGGLQRHQGLDIAIRGFQKILPEFPAAEFHIYGDGSAKPDLVSLARELGLEKKVRFFPPVPLREVAQIMANADLGVVPKRADSFGNEAYSTKIMEFMSLGVPVVVSRTKIDQFYFNDSVVRFFECGNADALAEAVGDVLRDGGLRRRMILNAAAYVARHNWGSRKADYLRIVDSLSQNNQSPARPGRSQ
jgi:glycosyltransferase involved in cell wall biosynthesis